EKAVRDYDSCIAEAEERGAAKQRDADQAEFAEQRAADRAEIARLLEEVNRLKAAVSESKN
ncbi:MAG: hypothetical protein MJ183_06810, partial [Treponemataceae bacterium]|nr:hypothetical protein [Treponemataceae bacterium]